MKHTSALLGLLLIVALLSLSQCVQSLVAHDVRKCLSSTSVAVGVLGQVSLDVDVAGCSRLQLGAAADIAVNPVTGDVFIADSVNNRILVYLSATIKLAVELGVTSFANIKADFVLGQLDFALNAILETRAGIRSPFGLYIDAQQNLWVACKLSNRVLKFSLLNVFVGLQVGVGLQLDAQVVLGQPDFLTVNVGLNLATSLYAPVDLFLDEKEDRLWVVDQGNKRVVFYNNASQLTIGAAISGQLGVGVYASANVLGLVSLSVSLDATKIGLATAVVVDAQSNVYIADALLNRVLCFKKETYLQASVGLGVHVGSLVNLDVAVAADLVIGQLDFNTAVASPTNLLTLNQPTGLGLLPALLDTVDGVVDTVVNTVDGVVDTALCAVDNLLVLDNLNHRLKLNNILSNLPLGSKSGGDSKSIIGQPSSTTSYLYGSPKSIVSPIGFGVTLNAAVFSSFYNWLFVATGSRVLVYLCI